MITARKMKEIDVEDLKGIMANWDLDDCFKYMLENEPQKLKNYGIIQEYLPTLKKNNYNHTVTRSKIAEMYKCSEDHVKKLYKSKVLGKSYH